MVSAGGKPSTRDPLSKRRPMAAPESLPSPRGVDVEMGGAVLAVDGLERIAEIASQHAGVPVAVIVPRLATPVEAWAPYERYVARRLAGAKPERPPEVTAEVPIVSGGHELGAVLMLGSGGTADAGEYLHVAAVAALTEVAVAEARYETEQTLRGSLLAELRTPRDLSPARAGPPEGAARGSRRSTPVRSLSRATTAATHCFPGASRTPAGSPTGSAGR